MKVEFDLPQKEEYSMWRDDILYRHESSYPVGI
jgi:hypothetical protein